MAENLTLEERWVVANQLLQDMIRRIVKAVEQRYGEEGKNVATGPIYDMGREVATKLVDKLGLSGQEPIDYAILHQYQDTNFWALKEEVIEGESGEVTIRVSYCPVKDIFTPKDCGIFRPYVKGMLSVVNPNLRWKASKLLTRGEDCCEFVITKE